MERIQTRAHLFSFRSTRWHLTCLPEIFVVCIILLMIKCLHCIILFFNSNFGCRCKDTFCWQPVWSFFFIRYMHHDSSCHVTQQIFLQSLVFWCLLLLGNMALSGSKYFTHYWRCYKQEIPSYNPLTLSSNIWVQNYFLHQHNFMGIICVYNCFASARWTSSGRSLFRENK